MKMLSYSLLIVVSLGLSACGSTSKKPDGAGAISAGDDNSNTASNPVSITTGNEGQFLDNVTNSVLVPEVRKVYFAYDSATIRSADRSVLDGHAAYLVANSNQMIRLEGHADERGSREYNLALGEQRAKAVQRYLSILGVLDSQVETFSYGEEMPIDLGHNDAAWSANRRVEIIYTGTR